jgi:hypothetical protein
MEMQSNEDSKTDLDPNKSIIAPLDSTSQPNEEEKGEVKTVTKPNFTAKKKTYGEYNFSWVTVSPK